MNRAVGTRGRLIPRGAEGAAATARQSVTAGGAGGHLAELAALMQLVQGRCPASFSRLYGLTSPQLFGIVLRIHRNRAEAEEVLQEVFVRVWLQCHQFDAKRGNVMSWLAAMAHHQAISRHRGLNRRPKSLADFDPEQNDAALDAAPCRELQPPDRLERCQTERAVQACLEALPKEHRESLTLAFFDGLTHAEIAQHLGRPVGTIKSWIRRSLQGMRPALAAL